MSEKKSQLQIIAIGMAMFSMFFGSGNTVFPVLIGAQVGSEINSAIAGFVLTAVLLPLFGLYVLSLYDGSYFSFFSRLGKRFGLAMILLIMLLVGPFAIIPRCIIIAYGSLKGVVPFLSLPIFSFFSCLIIFFCTYKKRKILELLGVYLTPLLLLCLFVIIIKGFLSPSDSAALSSYSSLSAFKHGLLEGYNTMDFYGSFLFSNVVLLGIRNIDSQLIRKPKKLLFLYLKASSIGMGLLALIYIGMGKVAAYQNFDLQRVGQDEVLALLARSLLGNSGGIIVSIAVCLACLTTAISLALVFSDFTAKDVFKNKFSYSQVLIGTLLISFAFSTLQFDGIQAVLVPILRATMPALILLTLSNLTHKVWNISLPSWFLVGVLFVSTFFQYFT